MTEQQRSGGERIATLEKEIEGLKGFDKSIKRNVLIVGLAMAAWGFFGLQGPIGAANKKISDIGDDQRRLSDSLSEIQSDIDDRKRELGVLTERASAAKQVADNAMAKAGSLEIAVGEAKSAAREARDASEDARKTNENSLEMIQEVKEIAEGAKMASEESSTASQGASAAAQDASNSLAEVKRLAEYAKDLTNDIDRTMRGYDRKIAVLSTTFEKIRSMLRRSPQPQPSGAAPAPKPAPRQAARKRHIKILVSGAGSIIRLNPGPALLDNYTASAAGYKGEYLIPESATVELTITGSGVMVYAHPRLRGRITEHRTGSGGQLVYR